MIISFKHNYIYFRPRKTGSSTIEEVLVRDLGPGDVVPGVRGRRVARTQGIAAPSGELSTHTKAAEIKALVPDAFWQGSFKFASVRHPYEKVVSLAFYRLHKTGQSAERQLQQLATALDRIVASERYNGFEYYSIDGTPVVDDFIRHETFEEDLRRIASRLGIRVPAELPRKKGGLRLDRRPAREILSDAQKQAIFERCRQEFEVLGYQP